VNENRGFALIFLIVIVALIAGLLGVGSVVVNLVNSGQSTVDSTTVNAQEPDTSVTPPVTKPADQALDYNFTVTSKPAPKTYDAPKFAATAREYSSPSVAGINTTPVPTGIKDQIIPEQLKEELKKAPPVLPDTANSADVTNIKIPSIGIDSPIVQGPDGDQALDNGMWLYPTSYNKGEKILLCHRRYFGTTNPKTCWFMDRVKIGDKIEITDRNGKIYNYTIVAQAVREGSDLSIYRTANDDLIKVVTCTPLGSSSHRLVTIAKRA
jgi:LPXTG-site transpeptidase (sortase) family protein